MLDLQKDKPYMHSDAPRPAVEDQSPRQTTTPMTRTTIHPAPLLTDDGSDDEDDNPLPLAADDDSDNESDDDSRPDYQLGEPAEQDDYGPPHPNKIVLPDETRPIEELRDGARHTSSHKRTRPQSYINQSYSEGETTWEENGELVRGINIIEQINAHMQTDDNDNEARTASLYRMLTMHDSEILSVQGE